MQSDFEILGQFYLGKEYDLKNKALKENLVLYDSKDLVTHAVCVGMTGSGKTGLCLTLLEEAAIDHIPALVIDPKGDLPNLLLTFPKLKPEDFEPWINIDDARKRGVTPTEFAKQQAELWKKGLAEWGQDGDRIGKLRDSAEFAIYTPGSNAGISVSILQSFAAPEAELIADTEMFRERINTTATSLLALVNIAADPIQSREHILISTILDAAWKAGKDLDLQTFIRQIQSPPVTRIGVLDLETFFPSNERFALAMQFNNLLAAPSFQAWMQGERLDIQNLLYDEHGKPRIAIFSIAHLGDTERMFFVTLLLNQVLGWMRAQPGTTSLRALLYMDEIFGYFPPVANPPSKMPLLTLLKQARAYGLGVVLATQNPVDLDYKGLSNAGTWFIGRLQTERDKGRVLDGLEGAAATVGHGFQRKEMEQTIAGLGNRVFLLHNVHEDRPVVFQTRWALSYLRGPLTRQQIKTLMPGSPRPRGEGPGVRGSPTPGPSAKPAAAAKIDQPAAPPAHPDAGHRPVLPPEVPQFFLPLRNDAPPGAHLHYEPRLLGSAQIYYSDAKTDIDLTHDVICLAEITDAAVAVDWPDAEPVNIPDADLEKRPAAEEAQYTPLPRDAAKPKSYDSWKKSYTDYLYRSQRVTIFKSKALKEISKPNESERDFRVRLQQAAHEERDRKVEQLRQKLAPKVAALEERIRKAEQAVLREKEQSKQSIFSAALSFGSSVLGAFMGRKVISATNISKAATAARSAGRTMKDAQDVKMAEENVGALQKQKETLEKQFQEEVDKLAAAVDPLTDKLLEVSLKPKKTNITVRLVALVWAPHWRMGQQTAPAWE
jgi:hypothetical protein